MDTGSANLMTSPQWITYGVSAARQQAKWYANGGCGDLATSGIHLQDPAAAAALCLPPSPFYARHGALSPPHHSPLSAQQQLQQQQQQQQPSSIVVGDVMYQHHHQTGPTANLVDVLPKFPPPMFDIPDIQDSNSVFEGDASRRTYGPPTHHHSPAPGQPHRQLPAGWLTTPTNYWSPTTSSSSSSSVAAVNGACSTGSSGSSNSSPAASCSEESNRSDVGTTAAPAGTTGVANSSTRQAVLTEANDSSSSVAPPAVSSSTKRTKSPKKRKRRDPNEPQKPVSAYSLFFRNAQAAIKNRNPSATFGDVSKIVASMWDNLDDSVKNYYKRQMETAKKEYLKQLAIYRATLASTNTTANNNNNNAATAASKVSEDSVETVSSRNENEADQSRHSPSSSSASLLHVDGEVPGKMSSSPTEVTACQYSPVGQSTSPTVTSLHATAPPSLPLCHPMPSTAAMFAPPGNNYFPRYVGQRYVTDHVTTPQYMSSAAANGCYDNGSNYYMRPSYPPMSYNPNVVTPGNGRQYLGSQTDFQLMTGAP